jgi:FKBP-type peptidyl-prolyl cis-trans isomerase FkpA
MIRFFKIVLISSFCLASLISCKKDDDIAEPIPPIPLATQEPIDLKAIDAFLDNYSMKVTSDYDVTFEKILDPTMPNGLMTIRKEFSSILKDTMITIADVPHKVYYIKFEEGKNLKPTRVDEIFVSYKGKLLDNTTFDQSNQSLLRLDQVIQGWREIFPKFKTGTPTQNNDGTTTYDRPGAGVMFLPSALGYYNTGSGIIPAYAPLIFSFKLFQLNYLDHDGDGILSKDEDISGDGLFNNDDTDSDGIQNFLDVDDDGDNYLTKAECKFTYIENGVTKTGYYPFEGAVDDDLSTPYDERKGVPDCSGKIKGERKRRYLDSSCYKD